MKEILKGQQFLAELDLNELQDIANTLVVKETNKMVLDEILSGKIVYPEDVERHKQMVRDEFMKGGNKRFIEIFTNEFKNAPIDVYTNIAGKQKDLAGQTDKLVNVIKFIMSTYNQQTGEFMVFKDSRMVKLFNEIIEYSGLSPIDFYQSQPTQPMSQTMIKPLEGLAKQQLQPNAIPTFQ